MGTKSIRTWEREVSRARKDDKKVWREGIEIKIKVGREGKIEYIKKRKELGGKGNDRAKNLKKYRRTNASFKWFVDTIW